MRHDWIFDVLSDLRSYALKNGLPALAAQVDATLTVARTELAEVNRNSGGDQGGPAGGAPPSGRPN